MHNPLTQRRAGVLLHLTSLPSPVGLGDLGKSAYQFIDFMVESGLTIWQFLPLNPPIIGLSPYQCQSAFATNPLLIDLTALSELGWLPHPLPPCTTDPSHYRRIQLRYAFTQFQQHAAPDIRTRFAEFCAAQSEWLQDFAIFQALKTIHNGQAWWTWQPACRDRDPATLEAIKQQFAIPITQCYFEQFIFFEQWQALNHYAKQRGIHFFGDIPIFIAADSADVWTQRDLFLLDKQGRPTVVAGVPPDYFSKTGQYWGNPLYNWEMLEKTQFRWWQARLKFAKLFMDIARIDHFRGFSAYWAIPATDKTAEKGQWCKAAGEALLTSLQAEIESYPYLVAEDLGSITPDVIALRDKFDLTGMRVLQFGFDHSSDNPHNLKNHIVNSIVYTGTHDNDTTLGWFQNLSTAEQTFICESLQITPAEMPHALIEAALYSPANTVIIPLQDFLAKDSNHRMNIPNSKQGNWTWQFTENCLNPALAEKIHKMVLKTERVVY